MPIESVRDAMHEKDRKGWSRKQAIAVGLNAERQRGKKRKMKRKKSRKGKRY